MCLVSLKYTMVCFQFLERARGYNDIEVVTCIYFYYITLHYYGILQLALYSYATAIVVSGSMVELS